MPFRAMRLVVVAYSFIYAVDSIFEGCSLVKMLEIELHITQTPPCLAVDTR